jgi:hypothetical protein
MFQQNKTGTALHESAVNASGLPVSMVRNHQIEAFQTAHQRKVPASATHWSICGSA